MSNNGNFRMDIREWSLNMWNRIKTRITGIEERVTALEGGNRSNSVLRSTPNSNTYYTSTAAGIKIEADTDLDIPITDVIPTGKSPYAALVWIQYQNTYYSLPRVENTGEVSTWVIGFEDDNTKLRIHSNILWSDCQVYAIIFVQD